MASLALLACAGFDGCTPYIGTTAASFLRKARTDPDPNIRYLAFTKLAQPNCYDSEEQKAEAAKVLIQRYKHGSEPLASRAVILHTLGMLQRKEARDLVLSAVNDQEPFIRVEACRALGKVGQPEDAAVLTRVMATDTLEDCRIAAIDSIGVLKSQDPRIARVLLAGMENDDPATRLASYDALKLITGKDLGTDTKPWIHLLAPDVEKEMLAAKANGSGKSRTLDTNALPASITPSPAQPAYPPQPIPLPPIDLSKDPEENKSSMLGPRRQRPTSTTPTPGPSSFPATNPNLPPP